MKSEQPTSTLSLACNHNAKTTQRQRHCLRFLDQFNNLCQAFEPSLNRLGITYGFMRTSDNRHLLGRTNIGTIASVFLFGYDDYVDFTFKHPSYPNFNFALNDNEKQKLETLHTALKIRGNLILWQLLVELAGVQGFLMPELDLYEITRERYQADLTAYQKAQQKRLAERAEFEVWLSKKQQDESDNDEMLSDFDFEWAFNDTPALPTFQLPDDLMRLSNSNTDQDNSNFDPLDTLITDNAFYKEVLAKLLDSLERLGIFYPALSDDFLSNLNIQENPTLPFTAKLVYESQYSYSYNFLGKSPILLSREIQIAKPCTYKSVFFALLDFLNEYRTFLFNDSLSHDYKASQPTTADKPTDDKLAQSPTNLDNPTTPSDFLLLAMGAGETTETEPPKLFLQDWRLHQLKDF